MPRTIISADSHIAEPPTMYLEHIEPRSQAVLQEHAAHLTEAQKDMILHDNVAGLYGLGHEEIPDDSHYLSFRARTVDLRDRRAPFWREPGAGRLSSALPDSRAMHIGSPQAGIRSNSRRGFPRRERRVRTYLRLN